MDELEQGLGQVGDKDEVCVQCVDDLGYQMEQGMETVAEQGPLLGQVGDGKDVYCNDDLD